MQKQVIILTLILAYFAWGVTLGYAPTTLHYTTSTRNFSVYHKRPAIIVVMKMNRDYPDMRLFQQWYDEYRAWWTIDVIGRRGWENSWVEYGAMYPENTAINLWNYLKDRDRTHIMVNPNCDINLPVADPEWYDLFEEETDLQYMDHRVWRLKVEEE